jgi:hypothetical protein
MQNVPGGKNHSWLRNTNRRKQSRIKTVVMAVQTSLDTVKKKKKTLEFCTSESEINDMQITA